MIPTNYFPVFDESIVTIGLDDCPPGLIFSVLLRPDRLSSAGLAESQLRIYTQEIKLSPLGPFLQYCSQRKKRPRVLFIRGTLPSQEEEKSFLVLEHSSLAKKMFSSGRQYQTGEVIKLSEDEVMNKVLRVTNYIQPKYLRKLPPGQIIPIEVPQENNHG